MNAPADNEPRCDCGHLFEICNSPNCPNGDEYKFIASEARQAASVGAEVARSEVQSVDAATIQRILDEEVYFLRFEETYDYGDAVKRILELIPTAAQGSGGCADIAAERQRQISKEGWTPDHDDDQGDSQLALAAFCYLYAGIYDPGDFVRRYWPWDWSWWKPSDKRRNLVRAGALIAAEIDRIDRESPVPSANAAQEDYSNCQRCGDLIAHGFYCDPCHEKVLKASSVPSADSRIPDGFKPRESCMSDDGCNFPRCGCPHPSTLRETPQEGA